MGEKVGEGARPATARGRRRSPGDGAWATCGWRRCAGEDGARFYSSPFIFSSFPLLLLPFFSLNQSNFSRKSTVDGRFLAIPPGSGQSAYRQPGRLVDKLAFKEQMASIVLKLGPFEEGEKIYRSLLFMNSDNYR
ncbi:hypothetical protein GW17_00003906 [Ensete ventricosum]|nr:hypothetical protein GW17_00003906 [Ensete ventricosum]